MSSEVDRSGLRLTVVCLGLSMLGLCTLIWLSIDAGGFDVNTNSSPSLKTFDSLTTTVVDLDLRPQPISDFPAVDWGRQRPSRIVLDVQPSNPAVSVVACLGEEPEDRTCRFKNTCFDTVDNILLVYSGDEQMRFSEASRTDGPVRERPLDTLQRDSSQPLVFTGSLPLPEARLTPATRSGQIPASQVATWLDAPHAILRRVDPSDRLLSVLDDYFPLWWLLVRWLSWSPQQSAGVLWWDHHREELAEAYGDAVKPFKQWFPGVSELDLDSIRRLARPEEGRQLVCFRSLVVGVTGRSALRNAAASFSPSRNVPEVLAGPYYAEYWCSHAEFANSILTALGLPSKQDVERGLVRNGTLGDVIILLREGGKGPRELSNADKLASGLVHVCGGRRVRKVLLGTLDSREQARELLHADVAIALHGVGDAGILFMRPGTVFIDLLPPRATAAQPEFLGLAQRLGVRLFTMPVVEHDCAPGAPVLDQASYAADVEATRALAALAVGHEP